MHDPYLVETKHRVRDEWLPVMPVPTNDRKEVRKWLAAQGYRWMDRRACPANPSYVREWRIVPNPQA
ncbi:MAG TPA: hypothetical protein VN613_06015 [Gemmatimonadaceae bacterium]|nr:hypothetical protein [Gemmatimonadaceae bacterium]